MGCGVSKLDPCHKPHLGRIRPVFYRRYQDIRGSRGTSAQHSPSVQRKITQAFGHAEARRSIRVDAQCRGKMGNDDARLDGDEESAAIDDGIRISSQGSPSFRVYCKESADHIFDLVKQEDMDGYIDADDNVEGHRSSVSEESTSSNEVSVHEFSQKEKMVRVLKKMPSRDANNSFSFCNSLSSSENSPLIRKAVAA